MAELRAGGATKMLYLRQSVDERLLTASWCRVHGQHVEVLPALDGHGVDIVFKRTSRMSRAEVSELCDYIAAWGGEHDVRWTDAIEEQETAEPA